MAITLNGSGTVTGISAGGLPDGCITTDDIAASAVTQAKRAEQLTLDTAKTATGTAVDFTGIPSWVKRVTVMFNGVSTNSTSNWLVQLGSTSFATSGYLGASLAIVNAAATAGNNFTNGIGVVSGSADNILHGSIRIETLGSNAWVANGAFGNSGGANMLLTGGSVTLSGTLDRIRITTANGTDTFDAGTINILYE